MHDGRPIYIGRVGELTVLYVQSVQSGCTALGTIDKELTLLQVSKPSTDFHLSGMAAATEQGED